jgi:hypothetical protein
MMRKTFGRSAQRGFALIVVLSAGWRAQAQAQDAKNPYPRMAPLEQYLMERNAEIALARSAAPDSISRDAEVMVLGQHGYEAAVKGKNGFVCIVERSWMSPIDDPGFWNPKMRGPVCFNAPAARFNIPVDIKKTESVLAGRSNAEIGDDIKTALDKKQLPALEPGAMCYMMSKQGYLNDAAGHWHPHLMFLVPATDAAAWGANLDSSPILALEDHLERYTLFLVPIDKWSDGTAAHADSN